MTFWNFVKTKQFWKHFGLIILAIAVLLWLTFKLLGLYTSHGQSIKVPDFTGMMMDEIENYDSARHFNFEITDSIYDIDKTPGSIVNQIPLPGSNVKKGRTIYITLVSLSTEMVKVPNLNSLSKNAALRQIENSGLKIGKIEYVSGDANVQRAKYKGKEIDWDTKVPKGSKIDLVIGKDKNDGKVYIPNLVGKSRKKAKRMLDDAGLFVGAEIFDSDDTIHVVVRKQKPAYDSEKEIKLGESIDLWFE